MATTDTNNVSRITFDQIANCVAISEVADPCDSVKQLVLQCLAIAEGERVTAASQLQEMANVYFAVPLTVEQVQQAIDALLEDSQIFRPDNVTLVLEPSLRVTLRETIDEAHKLEARIKEQWFEELAVVCPGLSNARLWNALRSYLGKAFRRHGMQTLSLLDPAVEVPQESAEGLGSTLHLTVREHFATPADQVNAMTMISRFMADVGKHKDRSKFVAELADAAFHLFALVVDPEVAAELRRNLSELVLFCDTNFLFGILDLHAHPQVQVSRDLLRATRQHNLPIKLRYHEATLHEMMATIYYYGDRLKSRHWTQAISRAALKSLSLSGIELKYHQLNAESHVDPGTFLGRYEHLDVLLKEHSIDIYRPNSDRTMERALLYAEYEFYLECRNKEKPYDSMDHDTTVLDTVKSLRSSSKNSLDAKALMITCDYTLFRFDWELGRQEHQPACTVIPNTFWQLIRPYIPSGADFDKSFAETFAIPEFRTMGSSAARACSKMLSVLATYKDLPEETATRILSNRLLIDKLTSVEDDSAFEQMIESAVVSENQVLLEEKVALQNQLAQARAAQAEAEARAKEERRSKEIAHAELTEAIRASKASSLEVAELQRKAHETETGAQATEAAMKATESKHKAIESDLEKKDKAIARYQLLSALLLSMIVIAVTEATVHIWWRWEWLMQHQASYAIQGLFDYLVLTICVLSICTKWRKAILLCGALVTAVVVTLLSQLGGAK